MIAPLESRLSSFRRGLRLRFLWGGLARVLTVAALAVTAAVALDYLVRAERPVRAVFAILAAGIVLGAARRALWGPLSLGMSDEDLALAVEARHPELKDRLISALQLARARPHAFNSPLLVAKVIEEALEACRGLSFPEAVRSPRQRRWTLAALAAGGLFAALASGSETFRTGLARLVLDRPWPSLYALEVSVPSLRIAQGEDLPVTARLMPGSHPPHRVVLHVQEPGGEDAELTMPVAQDGNYVGVLQHLTRDLTVWVTARDFASQRFSIRVLEKPVVSAFQVRMTPPEYTGLPPADLPANTGHLRALRGSRVRIEGSVSKPLRACALAFSKRTIPLALEGQTRFSGEFLVEDSDSYVISLEDLEDLKAAHPVSYQVTVLKDQDPFVRIPKPGKDMGVVADAEIPIQAEAQDDFGLGAGTLVTVLNRGTAQEQETRTPLFEAPAGGDLKSVKAEYLWKLAPLKLEPGRQLRYRAEARDLDTVSGPNLGRSQEYGITIVSREDFQNTLQQRLEEIVSDLGHAREDARRIRSGMEESQAGPAEAREGAAAALALDLGRLGQSLAQSGEALAAVQETVAMNRAGDARRDEMLQAARQSLKDLAAQGIPAVSDQVKAGGRGEEAAWSRALEGQAGVIGEIEKVIKGMEGAASFGELLKRLERLIDASDRIKDRAGKGGGR